MAHGTTGWQVRSHRWQKRVLDLIVDRRGEDRSTYVRQALTEYLERHFPAETARAKEDEDARHVPR
jgi:Arc/MetJ-type ribon-helix-helix transcriptional regulator